MTGRTFELMLALILVATLLNRGVATACQCVGMPETLKEARERSQTAFIGRVIARQSRPPRFIRQSATDLVEVYSTGDVVRYVLLAEAIWKGAVAETLVVYSGGLCGFPMEVGDQYVLFAQWRDSIPADSNNWRGIPQRPVLTISKCLGSSTLAVAAKDLATLGAPIWPKARTKMSK